MSLALSQHPGTTPRCTCSLDATASSVTPAHAWWHRLIGSIRFQLARRRQRHDLAALDDRLLADIGLTRAQARREARKPLWA